MSYTVSGSGRDVGLLLIHPLGADRHFWDACIAVWQDSIACVALDLRAGLPAGTTPQPVPLQLHAQDLEAVRAAVGLRRVIPVGCAIGSMIAAAYAARYPERIAALVLSNPAARSSPEAGEMLRERARLVASQGMQAILPGAVERAFLNQPQDARYSAYYRAFAAQSAQDYALACIASSRYDAEPALRTVRWPTLVIAGRHDALLPASFAQEVADLVAGSRFAILEEAAHFAPYQHPVAFARLMLRFLAEAVPETAPATGSRGGA